MMALNQATIKWIDEIRRRELDFIISETGVRSGRILDIGGGTGAQASVLQSMGLSVESIDLLGSGYRTARVFPIIEYDGSNIPFADGSFDMLFSSNVLEHIAHLNAFHAEMLRVLKPGGCALHVMPSSSWRAWTMLGHYLALPQIIIRRRSENSVLETRAGADGQDRPGVLKQIARLGGKIAVPERHGERGNRFTEILFFRANWWRRSFEHSGWIVERIVPVPFFYTGNSILGPALSLQWRQKLTGVLGASSNCFIVRKPDVRP